MQAAHFLGPSQYKKSDTIKATPPGIADPSKRILTNPVLQDHVTWVKYGAETNGEYTLMRLKVAPGGGTPLHYHDTYTETFRPLSGTATIHLDGKVLKVKPGTGDSATVPMGTVHCFRNEQPHGDGESKGEIEFECEIRPAHEGFERSLYILYGLAKDGMFDKDGVPTSFFTTCLVADMSDMRLPGVMWVVGMPVVKAVAAFGRWMGWERELTARYWC